MNVSLQTVEPSASIEAGQEVSEPSGVAAETSAPRIDLNEENVGKGLAQLVLTVVRLVHELLERQAIRRMDAGGLTDEEVDRLGRTLQAQAREIRDMAERFDLSVDDLNLDLGPLGKVL
ncbi:MAG: gas vesicle protein K [Planctomycetota bacterium]